MSTLFMVCSDCAAVCGYLDVNSVVSGVSNPKPFFGSIWSGVQVASVPIEWLVG